MKTIKIGGFKITIKTNQNTLNVYIYKGIEKMPFCGTIICKMDNEVAERWAINKISKELLQINLV